MTVQVDIQRACEPAPEEEDIRGWIRAALRDTPGDIEISVRLVDEAEMTQLNSSYRGKSGATNVLSFPAELPEALGHALLGDIVVCVPVVEREARAQAKTSQSHWAHMMIHGTLHLLGYDHLEDEQAETMEALETRIMQSLDFPCPYQDRDAIQTRSKTS